MDITKKAWWVPLALCHQQYQTCELRRSFPTLSDWTVVMVDTRKLVDCWRREAKSLVVPRTRRWKNEKVRAIRDFLDPSTGAAPMPQVSFSTRTRRRFFCLPPSRTVGVVSFVDGRHRVRYLESAGAERFPVEVPEACAGLLQQYCGYDAAQAVYP